MEDPSFTGRVEDLGLLEFLQVVLMSGKSMIVEIRLKNGLRGLVYLKNGQICHANCGDLEGEEARYHCIAYSAKSFSNLPSKEPERVTIQRSSEYLLVEASRLRDELYRFSKVITN